MAVLVAAAIGRPAAGAVIFDSFGPGNAVDPAASPYFISGGSEGQLAVRFVPGTTYGLTQVSAYLRSTGGNGQSSLLVKVVPDTGGLPADTPIWTSSPQIVSSSGGVYTFTSVAGATVSAGQTYWVVIDGTSTSGNAAIARPGLPNVIGTYAERFGGASWTIVSPAPVPAVRVEGAGSGACCNRATGGCAVLTSAACASVGLWFDGNGTVCSPATCRACPGDFNRSGTVSTQDLFEFLTAYFSPCL